MTALNTYRRWLARVEDDALRAELSALDEVRDVAQIEDRFYRDLAFGTGGLRGVLGAGTNRMNVYVVRRATQGLAAYLKAAGLPLRCAIAYDSRIGSARFARETARVLAANGVTAYLYPRLEPTPALSWAVRYYGCGAGVCVTASHNPAAYNGYKVYGPDGCQITVEAAEAIQAAIDPVDCFDGVKAVPFDRALEEGFVQWVPERVLDRYIEETLEVSTGEDCSALRIVYTPLHGVGLECVSRVLEGIGVADVATVDEQCVQDGDFPTCPYPNPEIKEAMALGMEYAKKCNADLLLATDPDCDRVGIAVKNKTGEYELLTGNQTGMLLLDYICSQRVKHGKMPADPVMVKTIVTMDMGEQIATHYGLRTINVLTGFKFIGEQIGKLEAEGRADRYIFGFEESYGYLSGAHVRDKDAVNATLLVCEAAAWYAQQGKTLLDAIEALYKEFGYFRNALCSFAFEGESGMHTMQNLMKNLRANTPAEIAGYKVDSAVDYDTDGTGLPRANVLEYHLAGGHKLMVRPSGTEPKIKVYLSAVGESEAAADAVNAALAEAAAAMMKV